MIGQTLGPYEIVALLGEGGMGQVYRARDTRLGRDVAIKILPAAFSTDPDRLARFQREARLLASLNHPNIAQVYGVEESAAGSALVMELVPGRTLEEKIGTLSQDDALAIARQVADALDAAHEAGIIHRDLKPANIKVRDDGIVKVLDFGLAKSTAGEHASSGAATATSPTMTSPAPFDVGSGRPEQGRGAVTGIGMILGTASHMAPEQAKGKAVDKRADIWAFGVVLFEMLTGATAFPGETVTDVMAAVVTRDPDWALVPATVPPATRRMLRRCLEKDPKRRVRDIGEARFALDDVVETGPPAPAGSVGARRTSWLTPVLAGLLLTSAVAIGVLVWRRPVIPPAPALRYDTPAPAGMQVSVDQIPAVAISPDGSTVIFAATAQGTRQLFVRRRDDPVPRPLEGTEGASAPSFSPDGRWVAFSAPDLMRMPIDGGPPVLVAKISDDFRGADWIDDTTLVFSPGALNPLFTVTTQGGDPKALTTLDTARQERTHRWPAVTPDRRAVLFTVGVMSSPDNYDNSDIDAVEIATGRRTTVLRGASFVRFAPDGYLLFARGGTLSAVKFDSATLTTSGDSVPLLSGLATDTTSGAAHVASAADGTLVYVPGGRSTVQRRLVWMDREGAMTPLPLSPAVYNDPQLSPDGSRLAYVAGLSGSGDVYVYDFARESSSRFTFDGENGSPVWSRDGDTLYYASVRPDGRTRLMRKPANGSRDAEEVAAITNRAYAVGLGPPGTITMMLQTRMPERRQDIVLVPIGPGGAAIQPLLTTSSDEYSGIVSPDGRWLAYSSDESGRYEISVRDLSGSGSRWQISAKGGEEPRWSPDGTRLYFRIDTQLLSSDIQTKPEFRFTTPKTLLTNIYNLRSDTMMSYDVDPKTGRFLMIRPVDEAPPAATLVRVVMNLPEDLRRLTASRAR